MLPLSCFNVNLLIVLLCLISLWGPFLIYVCSVISSPRSERGYMCLVFFVCFYLWRQSQCNIKVSYEWVDSKTKWCVYFLFTVLTLLPCPHKTIKTLGMMGWSVWVFKGTCLPELRSKVVGSIHARGGNFSTSDCKLKLSRIVSWGNSNILWPRT